MSACASGPPSDPWAGYNHAVFQGNERTDTVLIEPVARGYRAAVPEPARDGLHNFLSNLRAPTDLLNNTLQGQGGGAADTVVRFGINSTLGLGGLFDPASEVGIDAHREDFGQTLAVWGVGTGPYLILPFFGPSNARDTTGFVADIVTHPVSFLSYDHAILARMSRLGATGLDQRTRVLDLVENIRETSLDPYASMRSLYEQSRKDAIRNGELDVDDLANFDEFDEFDDDDDE